jgi:hypothetical protein
VAWDLQGHTCREQDVDQTCMELNFELHEQTCAEQREIDIYIYIYIYINKFIGGWGVTLTGKSFRFVRACARSGCQVEFESFPFSLLSRRVFPFSLCGMAFSLFPM